MKKLRPPLKKVSRNAYGVDTIHPLNPLDRLPKYTGALKPHTTENTGLVCYWE